VAAAPCIQLCRLFSAILTSTDLGRQPFGSTTFPRKISLSPTWWTEAAAGRSITTLGGGNGGTGPAGVTPHEVIKNAEDKVPK
jgi:hypothetical protein